MTSREQERERQWRAFNDQQRARQRQCDKMPPDILNTARLAIGLIAVLLLVVAVL